LRAGPAPLTRGASGLRHTEACPREIRITKGIGEVRQAILKGSADAELIRYVVTSAA
jgi:hypothetical protein